MTIKVVRILLISEKKMINFIERSNGAVNISLFIIQLCLLIRIQDR